MRIMVVILVVYMKQDQESVKIIHQNPDRKKSVMQIGKNIILLHATDNYNTMCWLSIDSLV